jgi:hypothetical protein
MSCFHYFLMSRPAPVLAQSNFVEIDVRSPLELSDIVDRRGYQRVIAIESTRMDAHSFAWPSTVSDCASVMLEEVFPASQPGRLKFSRSLTESLARSFGLNQDMFRRRHSLEPTG